MAYDLFVQDEAVYEIGEAFDWYEEQKPGLGYELLDEIKSCYKKYKTIRNITVLLQNYTEEHRPNGFLILSFTKLRKI